MINAIVEKDGLEKTKSYLETIRPEMRTKLKDVKEDFHLSPVVREYCVFPGIALLEGLVEDYSEDLPKVKQFLEQFVKERDQLYEQVLLKDFVEEVKSEQMKSSCAKVILLRES